MVKTYDPAKLSIIIAGFAIEGFADGTFIVCERNNQSFNAVTGADGEGARAKSNDSSGTITITLLQTSKSNEVLSALALADEVSGDGVGPFMAKDQLGNTVIAAGSAWVQKPANAEFGREIANREWVLETDNLEMFLGGTDVFGA